MKIRTILLAILGVLGGGYLERGPAALDSTWRDGPAVAMGVFKAPGANALRTIDAIKALLAEARESLSRVQHRVAGQ